MLNTTKYIVGPLIVFTALFGQNIFAMPVSIYEPRVPEEILEEVQDIENPYPATDEQIEAGRKIYYGKGMCVNCHNKDGRGAIVPGLSPRNFTDTKWQKLRTDGELMWVLRNGSPGTGMPIRVGKVITENEGWSVINFIRTFGKE